MNGLCSKHSFVSWLFVSMRKHIPSPHVIVKAEVLVLREGSIEKKVPSQVCRHRRQLEQIVEKVKLISSALRPAIPERGNSRSRGGLMKDKRIHDAPGSGRE